MSASSDLRVLALVGPHTIREAAETQAALSAALHAPGHLTLDCAAVTEVDLNFVQMLIAAGRSAAQSGRGFALRHPPDGELRSVLVRAGLLRDNDPHPSVDPGQWSLSPGGGAAGQAPR